eukprot:gnl/TRDRNA2_/TRDRNA2_119000_c0_seq1.p1 gnl/TRDRNA2_/TRDRNA2_119000_c0~~gnl/TRDRNA2_/TRDRNA2_119000_c0_seq1.p1  ORF type:complete len:288 (+),score=32.94 gnl/TRDRNA2_/TRDRNA2_119000_c0_seq1:1-864(+)
MSALCALAAAPSPYVNDRRRSQELSAAAALTPSQMLLSDHHDLLTTYYRFRATAPDQQFQFCQNLQLTVSILQQVADEADQLQGILCCLGFNKQSMPYCGKWILASGTDQKRLYHRQWAGLTYLLGQGMQHFALRKPMSRQVWLQDGRPATAALSPGIPDSPIDDSLHPFLLFSELRPGRWSSSCRGATAAGGIATLLGAARFLGYDSQLGCAMLDGWAPIRMSFETAARLGAARTALWICLLDVARVLTASGRAVEAVSSDVFISAKYLGELLLDLCDVDGAAMMQ